MDDHPYYLRQRSSVLPVATDYTLSSTSITAPIASSSVVNSSSYPVSTSVRTPLPTMTNLAGSSYLVPTTTLLSTAKITASYQWLR